MNCHTIFARTFYNVQNIIWIGVSFWQTLQILIQPPNKSKQNIAKFDDNKVYYDAINTLNDDFANPTTSRILHCIVGYVRLMLPTNNNNNEKFFHFFLSSWFGCKLFPRLQLCCFCVLSLWWDLYLRLGWNSISHYLSCMNYVRSKWSCTNVIMCFASIGKFAWPVLIFRGILFTQLMLWIIPTYQCF